MLVTLTLAVATGVLAPQAFSAPSPTLGGEQLAQVAPGDVLVRCNADYFNPPISYQASGTATGAYAGTFASRGTARLSTFSGLSLIDLDATFEIVSPVGSLKGTLKRVDGRSSGPGSCAPYAAIEAAGIVSSSTPPDGTIDQGVVRLSLSNDPANPHFTATFTSTGRVADMDLDGVVDGTDNCPTSPNASQSDVDADGAGDACDTVDNRSDLFDDLVANSRAAGLPKTVVLKAERARATTTTAATSQARAPTSPPTSTA